MTDEAKCCHETPRFGVGAKQCNSTATVERDGKPYCGIHDPVRRQSRHDAQVAKWRLEWAAEAAERQADREELERLAGLPSLTDDELRAIIAAGGVQSLLGRR